MVDWKKTALKGLKALIAFGVPTICNLFAQAYPNIWNLPIGTAILMAYDAYVHRADL